ncbi:hypothetical protein [Rhodococcus jostii]|uniref:hypothetical protein n=1 Tax=Rhodococcus jostii TaxID=132919 RepID=UPI000933BC5F|nr:hypothetical protein [Rhodococcus jostii]
MKILVAAASKRGGIPQAMAVTGAVAHRIFWGKIDPEVLNLGERLVHAQPGDDRESDAVTEWADQILVGAKTST